MTRREMFKRIRKKLGLKKDQRLPKPSKIPTKILLEIGIEKWEDMYNHVERFSGRYYNDDPHFPYCTNCSLCYKFIDNDNLLCPLSRTTEPCRGDCCKEFENFLENGHSISSIDKVVKRLKEELRKEELK
jgi:hypothetical protein